MESGRAAALHLEGLTYEAIGERLGVSHETAHSNVQSVFRNLKTDQLMTVAGKDGKTTVQCDVESVIPNGKTDLPEAVTGKDGKSGAAGRRIAEGDRKGRA